MGSRFQRCFATAWCYAWRRKPHAGSESNGHEGRHMNKPLFHITFNEDWQKATNQGKYTPVEYFSDGFVLACYQEQLTTFANFLFHDHKKLLVLEIDPALLGCEVSEELSAGGSQMVPRIHGAIPVDAVVR